MKILFPAIAAALALGSFAPASPAAERAGVVVDFESLAHGDELQGSGDMVALDGFTFVYTPAPGEPYPTGFQTVGPSWRFNLRSAALNANSCSASVSLVADDGQPFSVASIDLAPLNGDPELSVTFVGLRAQGASVSHTMRLKRSPGWTTFKFPGSFHNLRMLSWQQGDCVGNAPHMFDNVVLSEPSAGG